MSINPHTGAITAIGPIGASAVPNGQGTYARLSVGSSTLYMEFNSNLYTINTATGAATQVGTTDPNGYLTSVLLLEYGTYYTASDSVIGIDQRVATGQIDPHSSIFRTGAGSPVALAPRSSGPRPRRRSRWWRMLRAALLRLRRTRGWRSRVPILVRRAIRASGGARIL